MIRVKVHVKFNELVISSIEKGVDHLKSVLSTGSSQEICIPARSLNQLCNLHTDVDVQILDKDERNCTVDLSIDYPICMCGKGSGISTFLGALLYYTVFSFVDEYSIYNFDLMNEAAYALFTGPKYGVTGIRELCEEREQPLIGLILKPRTKIDLSYQSAVVERLASSKSINYIIDDELVISSVCCPYEEKIDCYSALVNKIKTQYSHTMLYWVNVSCDIPIAEKIIEYSLKKGVSTFSLNAVTMGFTSVKYIIDKYSNNALFLINNIGRGILTRQKGFFISELVLSKISRLIGADAVYTGPITKDFPYNDYTLKEERVALQNVWGNYKKSFCVSSGNIDNAKNAKENIQALGKDTMIQMGAGLLRKDNHDTISKLSVVRFMVSNALNQEIMQELEATFSSNENSTGEKSMKHERRDFFISYNVADENWAKWIAETLENNGYKTFIQAWDIKPGDDFIVRMQEFLTNSERFLPILSSTYLDAPYCQAEWAPALATVIKDDPDFFIPIRIVNISPEGLLKTRVYIDLFDTQEAEATKRLLDGVKPNVNRKSNGFPCKSGTSVSKPSMTSQADKPMGNLGMGYYTPSMNQQEEKRVNLLKDKISRQINNRIKLLDALSKTRDPIDESRLEEDLEKCERTIIDFALQLANMSITRQDIDIDQVLTNDLAEICTKNAFRVERGDYQEIKSELLAVSQRAASEIANQGGQSTEVQKLTSEISSKESLELTIPIIPLLLNYKTELSFETKINFKKLALSLFQKIKKAIG